MGIAKLAGCMAQPDGHKHCFHFLHPSPHPPTHPTHYEFIFLSKTGLFGTPLVFAWGALVPLASRSSLQPGKPGRSVQGPLPSVSFSTNKSHFPVILSGSSLFSSMWIVLKELDADKVPVWLPRYLRLSEHHPSLFYFIFILFFALQRAEGCVRACCMSPPYFIHTETPPKKRAGLPITPSSPLSWCCLGKNVALVIGRFE